MRTIPKERILRINCAGYGTDAHWNLGRAKSLNNYSAIIVNPVSIAHLFDKDPELVRKVEQCLAEGLTSLNIDDDLLLRNLAAEIDSRVLELSDFLTQGGVLVYFLCRPFVIQGPSLALDNYYWLESLAPDQPAERNVRHMSAVSHGRLIEPTDDGVISEFAPYLQQHGLEWSTLIRTEYLTEGYSVMAEAGAKKCIAGQLFIVESSGKVVFLPSPYSPDFDKTLIECLNNWYETKEQTPEELDAERSETNAAAAASAQPAPQAGPVLFDRDQKEYEPVASAQVDTTPAAQSDEPLEVPEFAFNADSIAESVSQDAHRFEEEVANRIAQESKKTASIDLSIFAQTARQLVQKATDPQDEVVAKEEEAKAPAPQAEPAAVEVKSYALPPDQVVMPAAESSSDDAPVTSTGAHSLRNILSHAAPVLPESVMPAPATQSKDLLSEVEPDSKPQSVPPPAVAPKSTASLFDDDNEFGDEEFTSSSAGSSDSGVYAEPQLPPPAKAEPVSDSGVYSQPEALPANSEVFGQALPSQTDSGEFSQTPDSSTNSGVNNQESDPFMDSGVFSQAQPQVEPPQAVAEPAPPPAPRIEAPPQVESTILQPPSGFAATIGATEVPSAAVPPPPPPAQEPPLPIPSHSTAGDSFVTSNNDPNNHDNKSTMDLLRELERAQRQPDQEAPHVPPTPAPTMTAPPPADSPAKPLLNNLFKKDAADAAPMDTPLPAVPPPIPQAMPQAAMPQAAMPQAAMPQAAMPPAAVPPPAAPSRNTLGALMQPTAGPAVPQESLPALSKEGSNIMSNVNVPDWCRQYSFSYLDELKKEQSALSSQLQDVQAKLNTVESKITSVEQLKNALLSGEGESLKEACGLVLGKLGWTINHNNAAPNEVLLLNVDQPEALVRIVRSESHCDRSEVAQVSGSAIAFWEKHDVEPKGLLIACTWANISPQSRNQKDFEDALSDFAKKKNLCLMTTLQLIGIYRDLELGLVSQDTVRRQMLETNGCLTGYAVEAGTGMVGARA